MTNKTFRKDGGIYALVFYLCANTEIKIGALGKHTFEQGWYVYIGTAHGSGGVSSRVGRHAKRFVDGKKPKWQVDWFREYATLVQIWCSYESSDFECRWAAVFDQMAGSSVPVPRMGSSDCRCCKTHFYRFEQQPTAAVLRRFMAPATVDCHLSEGLSGIPTSVKKKGGLEKERPTQKV